MSKSAVLGVIYPNVLKYLPQYFESINNQNDKNFDLILYLDGVSESEISLLNTFDINLFFIQSSKKMSPEKIREFCINEIIKRDYGILIFTDCDDFYSENRVEETKKCLEKYDFCFTEIFLVNQNGIKTKKTSFFKNKNIEEIVFTIKPLINKNFIGLSNSAINLKKMDFSDFFIPENIVAVDWWIYLYLLNKGYKGKFLSNVYTYYRQHNNIIIGGEQKIDKNTFLRQLNIKKNFYENFSKINKTFIKEIKDLEKLDKVLKNNCYLLTKYLKYINNNSNEFLWWENINLKILEEL
ncbi:MAG: glycosyltransferase [Candidatus Muiribacteriota bacterium]